MMKMCVRKLWEISSLNHHLGVKNRTEKFRRLAHLWCKRQQRSDHGESGATLRHGLHRAFQCRCKSGRQPRARASNLRLGASAFTDPFAIAKYYWQMANFAKTVLLESCAPHHMLCTWRRVRYPRARLVTKTDLQAPLAPTREN